MNETPRYPKRLIEVDLPIRRISAHARREKSIRHGHISTLHIWWARRPLAACRAVLCAALWPDPDDPLCPDSFRQAARREMAHWAQEHLDLTSAENYSRFNAIARGATKLDDPAAVRQALLDFIADFADWDNSAVNEYVMTARALTEAAHEALSGVGGTRPLVVDPFAGGGSIPLEALRVGADAFASDLNPIPVLLNKVILEYVPRYGQRLAEELRRYGEEVRRQVAEEVETLYPNSSGDGVPIAYLWARTIKCEGPGCGAELPLIRSTSLAQRDPIAHVVMEVKGRAVIPRLEPGAEKKSAATVAGGKATCPRCGYTTPEKNVKTQMKAHRGGADTSRLFAVLTEGKLGRAWREPNKADLAAVDRARDAVAATGDKHLPNAAINPERPWKNTVGVCIVTRLGIERFRDLYTARQLLTILAFEKAIDSLEIRGDRGFRDALLTLLYLTLDRIVNSNSSLSRWNVAGSKVEGLFSKQALQVIWDFAETNPIGPGMQNWAGAIEWIARVIEGNAGLPHPGSVAQADARSSPLPDDSCDFFFTDPPYFAAIPYADLSDVFYVWLRRWLAPLHPSLFNGELVDKRPELIVTNSSKGPEGETKDATYFTAGMTRALETARRIAQPSSLGCVIFADASTSAWEAILNAVISAGWVITASWPIDTELQNRTRASSAASLQSSIFMVCRPREHPDGSTADDVGDWREVLVELPRRIHEWLPRLAKEGIVGADAIFACLGPALEIFSRYSRVEKANGDAVALREYLEQVWAAVAREALSMVLESPDTSGLEPDGRLTAIWLWTLAGGKRTTGEEADSEGEIADEDDDDTQPSKPKVSGFVLEFDAARKIAQGLGARLNELTHMIEVKGDKARLLPVAERTRYLFGKDAGPASAVKKKARKKQLGLFAEIEEAAEEQGWGEMGAPQAGKTTLDRIHQAMLLFGAGRSEALKRFLIEEGAGRQPQFWKLAQSLSALYPTGTEEKRWIDGVLARKKSFGFA